MFLKSVSQYKSKYGYKKNKKKNHIYPKHLTKVFSIVIVIVMIASLIPIINTGATQSNSQTKYENIEEYQKTRWLEISNSVFSRSDTSVPSASSIMGSSVSSENNYFKWSNSNQTTVWDGTSKKPNQDDVVTYTYSDSYLDSTDDTNKNVSAEVTYDIVYDVKTPSEFRYALEQSVNKSNDNKNILVKLSSDLDMNGKSYTWSPLVRAGNINALGSVYIEGNGHTIYNLKITGNNTNCGLFGSLNKRLIVKNLGFKSTLVLTSRTSGSYGSGIILGLAGRESATNSNGMMYFYNIHSDGAYMQGDERVKIGGLFGESRYYGNTFIKNCSTSNHYMYGVDHIAGLMAYTQLANNVSCQPLVKYDADLPTTPEAFVYQTKTIYPIMIANSYSVDCELFSTGSDSGAFISCGQSMSVRNCFTNDTIYANSNTGGFIGRSAFPADARPAKMVDDNGKNTIGNYFESCYSSGVVEGQVAMGGFTGLDNTYRKLENIQNILTTDKVNFPEYSGEDTTNRWESTKAGATVYRNCYSTAMVAMDYAGKYVGGFIGLDENYNQGATVNVNGNLVTANGSFYINCYSAGEVGNILTVTDIEKSKDLEKAYFLNSEGYDTSSKILDYYPTGGFIGMISPDTYSLTDNKWKNETTGKLGQNTYIINLPNTVKNQSYGYFDNCFYDMQTSAMHEMAVGLSNAKSFRDSDNSNKADFSITGIKGVYTEKSDVKNMAGLTDFPDRYAMDNDGENSSVWCYHTGYYPQLKAFMHFDLDSSNNVINLTGTVESLSNSDFYIPTVSGDLTGKDSHPVTSFSTTNTKGASDIIIAYRYCQASTATVLLSHWDYKMNTADGSLSTDNDWACAVDANKLSYNSNTGYFERTYTGLAAGTYEFKVQANSTMAYNYGSDKFDGKNCVLTVPTEDCNVKLMFRYDGLRTKNYQIYAVIYNSDGKPIDEKGNLTVDENGKAKEVPILLGGSANQVTAEVWTVTGSLPYSGWNPANTDYDMNLMADGKTYVHTHYIEPNKDSDGNYTKTDFQFKIAKDHSWNESYGMSGKSDNMAFSVLKPCNVTFKFDSKTHLTTVTADDSSAITDIFTEDKIKFDFKGYSVIGQQSLTGYNWLQAGAELDAANKGKLKETSKGSGIYEVTFDNVKMNSNYAYKVIENAVDTGSNSYFYIKSHPTDENGTCTVKFTFNSHTWDTTVSATISDKGYEDIDFAEQTISADFFSVIGAEELTGYFWTGDQSHPSDQSQESKDKYRDEAVENGRMAPDPGTSLYRKTFKNIPAGTYSFKVTANGSLDMSWGEDGSNENYTFTTNEKSNVTITFNSDKQTISVSTDPKEALDVKTYVVTGTENLMGKTWNLDDAVMTYNEETGVYEYIQKNVKSGDNYAFKVVEKGIDSGDNTSFYINGTDAMYDVKFVYSPKTGVPSVRILTISDKPKDVTADVIESVKITSYSVLGDKGLTGYNWLGLDDKGYPGTEEQEKAASESGSMIKNQDGTYTKVFSSVKVGTDGNVKSYPFKIAANGNWDSGISYGDENGDNFYVILNGDSSGVTECDVTINFNPSTGKITVSTNPSDCNMTNIDDSKFTWYIVGDYKLVSYDTFKASNTVYDTVRDITAKFGFTSGENSAERGVSWKINSDLNSQNDFYEKLGGDKGFSLDYSVDGKDFTGNFNSSVVQLQTDVIKDNYSGNRPDDYIANYHCNSFMPGKQWLTVSALGFGYSSQYNQWKSDYLKYVEYKDNLKKFQDSAEIFYKVLDSQLNEKSPQALISYLNTLKNAGGEKTSYYNDLIEDYGDVVSYYNAISTEVKNPGAAPSVSDQKILGNRNLRLIPTVYLEAGNDATVAVYEKSEGQENDAKNLVKYQDNSSSDVTFNNLEDTGFSYYNFAFTAGYAITDKIGLGIYDNYINQSNSSGNYGIKNYDKSNIREQLNEDKRKSGSYYAMTSTFTENPSLDDKNYTLVADELVKQSIIGSSYDYNSSTEFNPEKKQYGQTIVKVYKVSDTGTNSKINMNSKASENSDEYINYMKWTGQKKFTADDKGKYCITFFWALSDGRYLSDTKYVTINALLPGITKSVDVVYDETGDNTLTYNITYTNSDFDSPVTFAVLDVLPYLDDKRYGYGEDNNGTVGSNVSFNLKSLKIKQSGAGTLKGIYYSTDKSVRDYLFDSGGSVSQSSAKKLGVDNNGYINNSNGYWKNIIRADIGGGGTYKPSSANGVTAVAVSGVQLGVAESITVSITLEYNGKSNDVYVNNAYFYAKDANHDVGINGISKPVTTTIVGRNLDGYVWLDKNINGFVDEGEERLSNVTMSLYLYSKSKDKYEDTGIKTTTDSNGYYSFTNLSKGDYKVVLSSSDNPKINNKSFSSYEQTKKLLEARSDDVIGSRNISQAEVDSTSGYIECFYVSTSMPSPAEIYRRSYTNNINAKCDGFRYTKSYVNFGLTDNKCSVTLNKKGEDGKPLNGVAFKLEYLDSSDKWVQIMYDENGYVFSEDTDDGTGKGEFITGEKMPDGSSSDGTIYLPNLPEGKYRLTETKTVKNYNLLASSIEFELPYKVKIDDNTSNPVVSPKITKPDYSDDTYNYYRDIVFNVSNTESLNQYLPLTGSDNFMIFVIIGVILVSLGIAILLRKRKANNQSTRVANPLNKHNKHKEEKL